MNIQLGDRIQGEAGPAQIVLNAPQDQGTTETRLALPQVVGGQPVGAYDAAIQWLLSVVIRNCPGEGEAHIPATRGRVSPEVNAKERLRLKPPSCFFAHFPHD